MPVIQPGRFLGDSPTFLMRCLPPPQTDGSRGKTRTKANIKLLMTSAYLHLQAVKCVIFVLLFMQH